MGSPTLRAGFDTGGAKATCAVRGGAGEEMNITVVPVAIGVGAARSTGAATDFTAGAAEHLIFGAGDFVAASTPHCAVNTERGLVNMASEGV